MNIYSWENVLTSMSVRTKLGRGRPQKFGRHAKSVTLTLPDDVLERLCAIDSDMGRAIVDCGPDAPQAPARATSGGRSQRTANTLSSLLRRLPALKKLRGVQLVPVADGRALISLNHPHSIRSWSSTFGRCWNTGCSGRSERPVLEALANILRDARTSHRLTVVERSIIVFEAPAREKRRGGLAGGREPAKNKRSEDGRSS